MWRSCVSGAQCGRGLNTHKSGPEHGAKNELALDDRVGYHISLLLSQLSMQYCIIAPLCSALLCCVYMLCIGLNDVVLL